MKADRMLCSCSLLPALPDIDNCITLKADGSPPISFAISHRYRSPCLLGRQIDLETQSECNLVPGGGIAETYSEIVFQQSFQANVRRKEISNTRSEADTQTIGAGIGRSFHL